MAHVRRKTATEIIFENILFLADVFGDKPAGEIPNVPMMELAKCFEVPQPRVRTRRRPEKRLALVVSERFPVTIWPRSA